jgi:hypothetical protein
VTKKPQNWWESRVQESQKFSLWALHVHNFHIQALIEEFSTKKLWPLKGPFQCHITCSNKKSFGFFFEFKWSRIKISSLIPSHSFGHKFLSHNSKWHMWTHFSYIYFKTSLMVYWGPNLDHICYVRFCFKNIRTPMEL